MPGGKFKNPVKMLVKWIFPLVAVNPACQDRSAAGYDIQYPLLFFKLAQGRTGNSCMNGKEINAVFGLAL